MSIPKTIINLRENKNMTQAELSEQMQLDKNVMGRIERGERPLRDSEILKLAQVFNVSTDLILGQNANTAVSQENSNYWSFVEKKQKDIAKQMENIINQVETKDDISFYNKPLVNEDRKFLLAILKMGLHLSKEEMNK